jgi:hypothetical protein
MTDMEVFLQLKKVDKICEKNLICHLLHVEKPVVTAVNA